MLDKCLKGETWYNIKTIHNSYYVVLFACSRRAHLAPTQQDIAIATKNPFLEGVRGLRSEL